MTYFWRYLRLRLVSFLIFLILLVKYPRLQFTVEVEDHWLNFLNVTVIRDNELMRVQLVPLFWIDLNFWSQHSVSQKIGTIAGLVYRIVLLSNPKFHLDNLCFIMKILLENDHPLNFIFENINNREDNLKEIIMASNRKSIVNRVEVVQPSWFTVPFIRDIIKKIVDWIASVWEYCFIVLL